LTALEDSLVVQAADKNFDTGIKENTE